MQPRATHLRSIILRLASSLRGNVSFLEEAHYLTQHSLARLSHIALIPISLVLSPCSRKFSIRTLPSRWWNWRNTRLIIIHSELRLQVLDQVCVNISEDENLMRLLLPLNLFTWHDRIFQRRSTSCIHHQQFQLHQNPLIYIATQQLSTQFTESSQDLRANDSVP